MLEITRNSTSEKFAPGVSVTTDSKARTNFALLRLFFAALVIISHTAELHDGNRKRELLTHIFGTVSSGEVAVAAFFFISGYLITGSFLNSTSVFDYLAKRICRIYPGFIVAFFVCVFIVDPLGGGIFTVTGLATSAFHGILYPLLLLTHAAALSQPPANMAFQGTYYPLVDGAMWTIPYEFRCYLMVLLLGISGILRSRTVLLAMTATLLLLCVLFPEIYHPANSGSVEYSSNSTLWKVVDEIIGNPRTSVRFFAVFLCGALAHSYRESLRFSPATVMASLFALCVGMSSTAFASVALAVFGGYLILALATALGQPRLQALNPKVDISYGLYLYGWPVEKLIFWYFPKMSLVIAGGLTLFFSALLGALSWYLVEKRFIRISGSLTGARGQFRLRKQ